MREAGCVAFGNGLTEFASNRNLRRALEYAATFDLTVIFHSQDSGRPKAASPMRGAAASFLGLSGIPDTAETVAWRATSCWWSAPACARTSLS